MKKSVVYRTLQVASAVAVYSAISVWASTSHVSFVSDILTWIDSFLVILVVAVAFPYFCFKVFNNLYTPPNLEKSSKSDIANISEDEFKVATDMSYRGTPYQPIASKLSDAPTNGDRQSNESPAPIKYRGASVLADDNSSSKTEELFSTERATQKTAKPKERIKYRGSYVD
jgi:hypothetical protein